MRAQPRGANEAPTAQPRNRGEDISSNVFDQSALDTCISCGFCLPACPTYALTQDERSSPRGRITLMRALQDGRLEPDDATLREQSSFCLGCRACEPVCPAGVPYGQLLEQWRDHQWQGRRVPLKVLFLRVALRVKAALAVGGRLRGAAASTGPAADGRPHLMLGCAERVLFPGVSRAANGIVAAADVPSGQGCCGALHAHNGDTATGRKLAHQLGNQMPGQILTTSGGCAAHLVEHLGRARVSELSEYVSRQRPALTKLDVKVAMQDSCHLRNGLGTFREPRDLLRQVADYVELPSAGSCCGAAGTYSLLRPRDAAKVLAPKLDEIEASGIDYLVVVNPGCQRQLITGLRARRSRVRVLHLAELLVMAGGAAPAEPVGDRRPDEHTSRSFY